MTGLVAGSALAITLAVLGAACFAVAAVLQHRAVNARSGRPATGPAGRGELVSPLGAAVRQPGWIVGLGLTAAGSLLHGTALVLAPLSVVQPVGVLAVPMAVVLSAVRTGRRPGRGVLAGVAAGIGGVAVFVGIAAGTVTSTPPAAGAVLLAGLVVAGVVSVLAAAGLTRTGWVRCVTLATAGAAAFGLVSTLVRALSQAVTAGGTPLDDPTVLAMGLGVGVAVLAGVWLVQQAYASGPPEVVVACMTVVDPIVAVLLGVALLGEGAVTSATTWVLLAAAGAVAAAGVVGLARHHPASATPDTAEIRQRTPA